MRAQQATTRSRRRSNVSQPADTLNIQWTLTRETVNRVSIELRLPTTGEEAVYPDLVISQPPGLKVDGMLPTWTVVDVTPSTFAMECPEVLPDTGLWLLAPYDPGIRSSLGGYLLAKLQEINATVPLTWLSATRMSDYELLLTFGNVAGSILTAPIGHSWTPLGIPKSEPNNYGAIDFYAVSSTEAVAVWVEDITGETTVTLQEGGMVVDSTGRVLQGGSLLIT